MSQFDFGTINPSTKSGTDLASDLNDYRDAVNSTHRGATRPSYAVNGLIWQDSDDGKLYHYNGVADEMLPKGATTFGESLVQAADAGALQVAIDLEPGVDVQAYDALLSSLAGQTTSANKIQSYSSSDTASLLDFIDDDTMAAASATSLSSSESIVAYHSATTALTKSYLSSAQTITSGGLLTLSHGFSENPKIIKFYGICTTSDAGYSINDEVEFSVVNNSTPAGARLNGVSYDATNIYIRFSDAVSVFSIGNKTSGVSTSAANGSWDLYVRAFA